MALACRAIVGTNGESAPQPADRDREGVSVLTDLSWFIPPEHITYAALCYFALGVKVPWCTGRNGVGISMLRELRFRVWRGLARCSFKRANWSWSYREPRSLPL